ncbi:diphosphomevalonate decarboxylase [Hemicordylus capensis]|uniref:diphosphomevalonate decarboxylase n=1 Tax=Hemicordylus capensis TaxID=884348 RepID=UPI002304ADF8|nr:diphosphomevalonate decarboxylase [Hemicordylus capensis]
MAEADKPALSVVTCTAPVNIAVVKYWGKRDEELILPINSSLSITLHQDQLKTTTTAAISRDFKEDRLWLNGQEDDIGHPRLQSCLREVRRLARKRRSANGSGGDDGSSRGDPPPLSLAYRVHIASENNFPTAAGLASSAAGYACLVYTLAKLYGVEGELSEVARQGSGSACRSMFGGFVQWVMGQQADGKDSIALQVAPETHWPELRVLILVVSAEKKPVGSTAGMQTSVKTSLLLKHRAEAVVPERMAQMIQHVQQCNFEGFAELTMKDSNQFHATCLDTFPPIFYLNDTSKQVIALVHRLNAHYGKTKVAYTFDAGPNPVLFTTEDTMDELVEVVRRSFPPENNGGQFLKGLPAKAASLSEELVSAVVRDPMPGAIRYLLLTKPGPGPLLVEDASCHLLGADGLPRSSSS